MNSNSIELMSKLNDIKMISSFSFDFNLTQLLILESVHHRALGRENGRSRGGEVSLNKRLQERWKNFFSKGEKEEILYSKQLPIFLAASNCL